MKKYIKIYIFLLSSHMNAPTLSQFNKKEPVNKTTLVNTTLTKEMFPNKKQNKKSQKLTTQKKTTK